MNRRSFLRRLGAAAVALTLARHLPGIAAQPPALVVDGMSLEDFQKRYLDPAVDEIISRVDGIAIRYVRKFDIDTARSVHRFDDFMAVIKPEFAVRVHG